MNPRRLEDPFYLFWGKVFDALFYDDEEMLCAPQHTIYKSPEMLGVDPRLANTSLQTEFSSSGERRPDFTFIATRLKFRDSTSKLELDNFPESFSRWISLKIQSGGPIGFAEVKRPPTRRPPSPLAFQRGLHTLMEEAKRDLEKDVGLAFAEPSYKSDRYILIAAVGEWFCFKFARREAYNAPDPDDEDLLVDPRVAIVKSDKKKDKSRAQPLGEGTMFIRHTRVSSRWMEICHDDFKKAMPSTNLWSNYILFGTEAANQRFYLIDREVKKMQTDLLTTAVEEEVDPEACHVCL